MTAAIKTLFLPGAGASASFWKPVAIKLSGLDSSVFFAWPGLGNEPARSDVQGIDDLVEMVMRDLDSPVNIVSQSMGGLIAIKVALAAPKMIKSLVLVATSGGLPVQNLGGSDWKKEYFDAHPNAATWIADNTENLSDSITTIRIPTLLIWGDSDPISPIAVGQQLLSLLPNARLKIIKRADHNLAQSHAGAVAHMIKDHLMNAAAT